MLTVTEEARDRLSQKLIEKKVANNAALRFIRREGGWVLRPDQARPTDTTVTHRGRGVLLLDETVARAMADMVLDIRNTEAGPRLTLR
jgi:Fe-S cluster assembly iron-binding protein IscA